MENGMRVLRRLGLHDEIVAQANPCRRYEMAKIDGETVATFPVVNKDRLVTVTVLRSAEEGVYMHKDKFIVKIEQPTDGSLGVKATFRDGSFAYGDILIGADGVHSGVRSILFPDRRPFKSGFVGYLGVADYDPSFGWPLARPPLLRRQHQRQIHWALYEAKQEDISHDDWQPFLNLVAERARMADIAERWNVLPNFLPMIRASKQILPLTIYDLETLPVWHKHNCVLVGDAAHAMVPFTGQGCNVALEDTDVLATLLARFPTHPRTAFQLYQDLRYDRVRKAAEAARAQGKRQYSTSPTGAKIGHVVLKAMAFFASATGGNMSSASVLGYDGIEAVSQLLARRGYDAV
ncbi:hypothetical protein DFJ73DRAFT_869211 [Zopfochytrium polystomum]|nr:hypothetical protein DFJ73DRAFT_869211 [Zopfochytrium polystomum]